MKNDDFDKSMLVGPIVGYVATAVALVILFIA